MHVFIYAYQKQRVKTCILLSEFLQACFQMTTSWECMTEFAWCMFLIKHLPLHLSSPFKYNK